MFFDNVCCFFWGDLVCSLLGGGLDLRVGGGAIFEVCSVTNEDRNSSSKRERGLEEHVSTVPDECRDFVIFMINQ